MVLIETGVDKSIIMDKVTAGFESYLVNTIMGGGSSMIIKGLDE